MISESDIRGRLDVARNVLKAISRCIQKAVEIDLRSYLEENSTVTHNAFGFQKADYINTRMSETFNSSFLRTEIFSRQGWKGVLVIDNSHKLVFSVISHARLDEIRIEENSNPHYIRTLCSVLNRDVKACCRQLSFSDEFSDVVGFEQGCSEDDFSKTFGGIIPIDSDYIYCAIVHNCQGCSVQDISVIVMDDKMNFAYNDSLGHYLDVEYLQGDYNDNNVKSNLRWQTNDEKLVSLKKSSIQKAV